MSGESYRGSMMTVQMIGEVNKPGVHIVPEGSSFTNLLSYAGGPTKDANIEDIYIKRKTSKGFKNIELNFKDFLTDNNQDLKLQPNDLIYVEKESQWLSSRTLTIIATLMGAVVSGIVINDKL
jgi:protein involved in polysaccharide export with SLBB domain